MTSSLIKRTFVCAGIVALSVLLVVQPATAAKPKAKKLPICTVEGDIAVIFEGIWVCESDLPRFVDNGDGTVTDRDTGLMWEMKDQSNGVHDVDNAYTWTDGPRGTAANGTLYTDFLAQLNLDTTITPNQTCFANHCDWRIPNIVELQGIRFEPFPCSFPCIDLIFGPTQNSNYWASSTVLGSSVTAWDVGFGDGSVGFTSKHISFPARAVRGGW